MAMRIVITVAILAAISHLMAYFFRRNEWFVPVVDRDIVAAWGFASATAFWGSVATAVLILVWTI